MKFKGLLLDIDNTLYDYNLAHNHAKKIVLDYCAKQLNKPRREIDFAYEKARKQVHISLLGSAASHNRILYFQKMLEIVKINPMEYSIEINSKYWTTFLDKLKPFHGIYSLLEKYNNKICLVTDLTAEIQHQKIRKLKLEKYCDKLVTSEEAGHEKPHPYIFNLALQKLDLKANQVCMIGDNYNKDILGSVALGIQSIWFNHEGNIENYKDNLIKEVNSFEEILKII